jgi:hypothetical protein
MVARIYKPSRNAMQSGHARSQHWVLEFEPEAARGIEPLMGWTSSGDMKQQLRLNFDTKEHAIAYAQRNGLPFRVFEPSQPRTPRKSYADNFRWGRPDLWTH